MQRKRDGLVPIGEAFSGLGGSVKALRAAAPPTRRGFTVADQVDQLVSASEADPDLGFMARMMALCSLPRTNPGNPFAASIGGYHLSSENVLLPRAARERRGWGSDINRCQELIERSKKCQEVFVKKASIHPTAGGPGSNKRKELGSKKGRKML